MLPVRMTTDERRRRVAVRHRLADAFRADDPVAVSHSVVALHATDPTSVYLQVRARSQNATAADVSEALYVERSLVRAMGMRRTLFVADRETAGIVQSAAAGRVAVEQARLLVKHLRDSGTVAGDVERWLAEVCDATVAAVRALGSEATPEQLVIAEPRLRTTVSIAPDRSWGASTPITSRVLILLGCQGRLVRGQTGGGWASRRYRWSLPEVWLSRPDPGPDGAGSVDDARAELVRRWLAVFAPAPPTDLRWWTGWPAGLVKSALTKVPTAEVDVDGQTLLVLKGDEALTPEPEPWAALLPALDPTVMGWSQRNWYLGELTPRLFDRNGNAGPTVWSDGRVVGGWAQRPDGELAVRLFVDLGADARRRIDREADRLHTWLGELRFTPAFRTPTERELAAGP